MVIKLLNQSDSVLGELVRMRFSYDDGNISNNIISNKSNFHFLYACINQKEPLLGELVGMRFSYDDGNILNTILLKRRNFVLFFHTCINHSNPVTDDGNILDTIFLKRYRFFLCMHVFTRAILCSVNWFACVSVTTTVLFKTPFY